VVSATGSVNTPFGYAGEYTDSETGFLYLRARYYDPASQPSPRVSLPVACR
jgi:RHS repeat-associated protein